MSWKRFARVLVRKSARALKSAALALNAGDYDSAVNRSYYAMFDLARAALLSAGVAEDNLPRTHSGVIEMFRRHAVQSGLMDAQLASELSRIESLRVKADYTDQEMEPKTAAAVVEKAEQFTRAVERAFALDESSLRTDYDYEHPGQDDQVSEQQVDPQPELFEEQRRQARENWRRLQRGELQRAADIVQPPET